MANQRANGATNTPSGRSGSSSPNPNRSDSSSSKAASSPTESIDFRWLTFGHPRDAKTAQIRKDVRSHVTSRQHWKSRQALVEQQALRGGQAGEGAGEASGAATAAAAVNAGMTYASSSSSAAAAAASSATHANTVASASSSPSLSPAELRAWSGECDSESASPEASSPSPPAGVRMLPHHSSPANIPYNPRRLNVIEVYPREWHPFLKPVMDHYLEKMVIDIPEVDQRSRELIRDRFLGLVLSDTAPLHTLMLTAAAHFARLRGPRAHGINMLQLRGMAIQEINRALMDQQSPGRATSDQLVAAVGKMATYELLFGQRETFDTHMVGLQQMVRLRGGLQNLGLAGLLERSLLWLDVNAEQITHGGWYFHPSQFPSTRKHPPADGRLFVMGL